MKLLDHFLVDEIFASKERESLQNSYDRKFREGKITFKVKVTSESVEHEPNSRKIVIRKAL